MKKIGADLVSTSPPIEERSIMTALISGATISADLSVKFEIKHS